ncbi:MAG: hypothetical protein LBJ35_06740, partial [Spirochaetaceae bacterium]|nr:hypothetical protein [Spirochaetaceae bacterium]
MTAYRFMQANKDRYTIREMAGFLGVSSGACCQWTRKEGAERRNLRDARLILLIREIQRKH